MDIEGDIAVLLVAVVEVLVCIVSLGATVPSVVGTSMVPKKFVTIDLTYINDYMAFQFTD